MGVLSLPFAAFFCILDFVIWLATFGWVKFLIFQITKKHRTLSVPVDASVPSHRVSSLVASRGNTFATSPHDDVDTMYTLSKRSFDVFASKDCMKVRQYVGQKSAKVKEFTTDLDILTYGEVGEKARKFGAALRAVGLTAAPPTTTLAQIKTSCAFGIFENTCPEWMIAAQGCFTQSNIVTTIYATLGMDAVVDAVQECKIGAILCNKINVGKLMERIGEMPTLKTIIYTNDMVARDDSTKVPRSSKSVKIVSFDDFVKSGDEGKYEATPPTKDTCAVIMYTSGSTGKPKGVVVKHSHLLSCAAAAKDGLGLLEDDVYLGYLPLAHILELMAEFAMIGNGCTICYADPKTLTATGAYPIGALEQYSPTVMAGVPKIWDVIKKGVQAKIAAAPAVNQFLFNTAFAARSFAMSNGYDTPLFKALVFKKFAKVVGGRLRLALSGGGPLNNEVQIFVRTCFGCPLFQGYGLTETCAGLTIQDPFDMRACIAGVPISCCEVKLESCPDVSDKAKMPYLIDDTRDVEGNRIFGRGEVLVRGNNVSLGYYMMEEKTKEEWTADGWFHTGDIGQFMSDGSLRIVDRKKNLVKLKGGEYIAIENMEMTYGNSSFVDAIGGGICCYGDGEMDRPVAIMQLNRVVVESWAKKNGVEGDWEALRESKEVYEAVMKDMLNEHKKAGLSNLEKLVAIEFLWEPWTPENGCLTAANKLQRRVVIETFPKEFERARKKGIF